MTNNSNSNPSRRGATVAGLGGLALASVLLLCGAGNAPIENFTPQGAMQADLNAGGHNLTNAATINATNVATTGLTASAATLGTLTAANATVSGTLTATNFTLPLSSVKNRAELDPGNIMPGITYWLDAAKLDLVNGAAVSTVPDCLGSGTSASQTSSGSQPIYQVAGLNGQPALAFNGTSDFLTTSFSLGTAYNKAFTLVAVLQSKSATNTQVFAGSADSQFYGALATYSNGVINVQCGGTTQYSVSTSNFVGPMVIVISYDGTVLRTFVDGVEAFEQAYSGNVGATTALNLGALSSSYYFSGLIRDVVDNHGGSVDEDVAVSRWFLEHRGFPHHQILWNGDSLSEGYEAAVNGGLPYDTLSLLGPAAPLWSSSNLGWYGEGLIAEIGVEGNRAFPGIMPAFDPIDVVWLGTNDLYGGATGASIYSTYVSYCQALRALGYKVVAVTVLPRSGGGTPAGFETQRQAFNASVLANWATFADALADLGDDPTIGVAGASTNTTYYFTDQVHLINAGYTVAAPLMANALRRVLKQPVFLKGTLTAGACTINDADIVPGTAPGQPVHLYTSASNAGTLSVSSFTLPTGGAPGQVVVHSSNTADNDTFTVQLY